MKHSALKQTVILLTLLFAVASALVGPLAAQMIEETPRGEYFIANFSAPISPTDFLGMMQRLGVTPSEILFRSGDIQGGYLLQEGDSLEEGLRSLLRHYRIFLAESIRLADDSIGKASTDRERTMGETLRDDFLSAQEALDRGAFSLSGVRMTRGSALDTLINGGFISKVKPVISGAAIRQSANNLDSSQLQGFADQSSYHESWAPYYGTSKVTQSQTHQTFYFDYVGGFGSTATYEHETQVYDKNFANYANFWSSNLPSAYYDTPFSDSIDNFTIGSAQASSLSTYTYYYTHMALVGGSVSSATVRIKGQRGHRSPSWCYSTWCIYADATTSSMLTFTAPNPSGTSWTY